jgi:hypothetical protein
MDLADAHGKLHHGIHEIPTSTLAIVREALEGNCQHTLFDTRKIQPQPTWSSVERRLRIAHSPHIWPRNFTSTGPVSARDPSNAQSLWLQRFFLQKKND